jgi:hypothetical protein
MQLTTYTAIGSIGEMVILMFISHFLLTVERTGAQIHRSMTINLVRSRTIADCYQLQLERYMLVGKTIEIPRRCMIISFANLMMVAEHGQRIFGFVMPALSIVWILF